MTGARRLVLGGLLALVASIALAADGKSGTELSPFSKPLVLDGVLGDARIQMQLRPKQEAEEGLEGHYFVFGQSQQILLAGEAERDQLLMEESINGVDVSGSWAGTLQGGVVSGEWQAAGGGEIKPFRLEILRAPTQKSTQKSTQKPARKAAAKSSQ